MRCALSSPSDQGVDFGPTDVSALLSSLFDLALLALTSTLSTTVLSSVFSGTLVVRRADSQVCASPG